MPEEVEFQTKPEQAVEMLEHAWEQGVPMRWVTGDEVYGDSTKVRDAIKGEEGHYYMPAVSSNTPVWRERPTVEPPTQATGGRPHTKPRLADDAPSPTTVAAVVEEWPEGQWSRLTVAEGEKGPRTYDWAYARVVESRDGLPGPDAWLLARMEHDDKVNAVAFSPDGKWLAIGSGSTAWVWEVATGGEVARMAHERSVNAVAFSPDGRWLATGSEGNMARVWEAAIGQEAARMVHEGSVNAVTFSPDGKWLATGSGSTAWVWEATTGQEVARMEHDDEVSAVAFSPDGKWLATGSDGWLPLSSGEARVWLWQSKDLIADACDRLPRNLTREE